MKIQINSNDLRTVLNILDYVDRILCNEKIRKNENM